MFLCDNKKTQFFVIEIDKTTIIILINKVHIREYSHSDLEAFVDWQTDPKVARYLSWLPKSRAEAEASFWDAIEQQNIVERTQFFFAVVLNDTQEVVGGVGYTISDQAKSNCGWFIRKNFHGKGYATEAVNQMIEFAFRSKELKILTASCRCTNAASTRIMAKCGFVLENETENRLWFKQLRKD